MAARSPACTHRASLSALHTLTRVNTLRPCALRKTAVVAGLRPAARGAAPCPGDGGGGRGGAVGRGGRGDGALDDGAAALGEP